MTRRKVTFGFQLYRFKQNPEERRFSKAWHEQQQAGKTLAYLLGPRDPSDHDNDVAATVIQWLGSPVGQAFLRDLGYEKGRRTSIAIDPDVKRRSKRKERSKNILRKLRALMAKIDVELVNLEVLPDDDR